MLLGKSGAESTEGRGTRTIIRIAIGGIAVGMAVMTVAVAIVTGFREEVKNKVVGFEADLRITHYDSNKSFEPQPIAKDQTLMAQIEQVPGVRHVQVFATKAGIIRTTDDIEGIVVKGVGSDFNWDFFAKHLEQGRTFMVNDSMRSNEAIISVQTADRMKLVLGSKMEVYFIQDNIQRARVFDVVGLYKTGLEEMDRLYVLADIAHVQRLNNWEPDMVAGYEVQVEDFKQVEQQAEAVMELLPYDHFVQTIKELQPQLFDWLELQNVNVQVIITLMLLVAGFNMVSALIIIIIERVNMIGLLKTLGMNNADVQRIFLAQGLFLTGIGLLLGNALGVGACLLQMHFGWITLPEESYYMKVVPINLELWHLLALNAGSLLVCFLMLLGPSFMVARVSPLKAVRYE